MYVFWNRGLITTTQPTGLDRRKPEDPFERGLLGSVDRGVSACHPES